MSHFVLMTPDIDDCEQSARLSAELTVDLGKYFTLCLRLSLHDGLSLRQTLSSGVVSVDSSSEMTH